MKAYVMNGAPETSREAALSVVPLLSGMASRILTAIRARGTFGMTCDDVEVVLGMPHQTVSARFRDLFERGMIARTDKKRKTRSGRNAFVYIANSQR